VDAW